ncbi:peptide-N-glycosidase F-related protein [Flavobacterium silvaticum]|uniref:Peptide-N-glycosidase n=1 Tax=Flavobacterium silvaticum TaxID=1852020 RepID=A0A972FJ41_9FLAO|nr:peptide-N-glycosidase F-related protein [Flavobacterium silvaticum]NMH26703.1 peptide-N-glycosidase [Flavobacterium silvaticum]
MKFQYLLFFLLIGFVSTAQKINAPVKISYQRFSNGKPDDKENIWVYADSQCNWITSESMMNATAKFPTEQLRVEPSKGRYTQIAGLSKNTFAATTDSTSIEKQQFEFIDKTKKILGYDCKMAKTVINSNTIEVWYTTAGINAAPSVLGQKLGLVLEVVRNGNYVIQAIKIEKIKKIPESLNAALPAKPVDKVTYRDLVWKSRFTRVNLFDNVQVNFDPSMKSNAGMLRLNDGSTLIKKIKLPEIPKNCQLFADVSERSLGDAYDRTGVLFVIPTDDPDAVLKALADKSEYSQNTNNEILLNSDPSLQTLELIHFITPFGIGKYNDLEQKNLKWQDSVYYRQEITDLIPALSGKEILVGVTIGNYDKGGHNVSANLSIHDSDGIMIPTNTVAFALFNSSQIGASGREFNLELKSGDGMKTAFTLQKPLKNAKLRYITTGHGGWENGDEFIPKPNTLFLDGNKVFSFTPWRTDCGSYRLSNPASGNFDNGLSSSDYSRSNWCPGIATNPIWIELGDLSAGQHTISVKIPVGEPEGGSFSSWSVSGVLEGTVAEENNKPK